MSVQSISDFMKKMSVKWQKSWRLPSTQKCKKNAILHFLFFIRNAVKICTDPVGNFLYSCFLISQATFVQSYLIFFSQYSRSLNFFSLKFLIDTNSTYVLTALASETCIIFAVFWHFYHNMLQKVKCMYFFLNISHFFVVDFFSRTKFF